MKKILIGMGVVIFFLVFPIHFININTYEISTNKVAYDTKLPSIAHGRTVSQQFVPQYDDIESISICIREMACDMSSGYLNACIGDSEENVVWKEKVPLSQLVSLGWNPIFSNIQLTAGNTYYLNVEAVDTIDDGPVLSFYTTLIAAAKEEEGQRLTYDGSPIDNSTMKIKFEYAKPLNRWDYLAYYLFAVFVTAFFITNIKTRVKNRSSL